MREIAAEADLSPGNLYHYFGGKHEILYFCQDRWLNTMLDVLHEARLSGEPVAIQLRTVLESHVRYLLDEFEGSAAHLEVEVLPDELRESIIKSRDRYERGIRRLVSSGVRAGEFVPCDTGLVTRAILGALNWTARWYRQQGPTTAPTVARTLADYLVRGLESNPQGEVSSKARVSGGDV